jgi:hypothetical protein
LWFPFFAGFSSWFGLEFKNVSGLTVYSNFDGPLYIIPAKTLYDKEQTAQLTRGLNLGVEYYAAHLPVYPILIRVFAPILGFMQSMLAVNVLGTMVLAAFFAYMLRYFRLTTHPVLLATVFLFLPRFFVVRSIGAPESIFLLTILLSLFFFEKKQYLFAGCMGAIAVATKLPGILLFVAYGLVFLEQFFKMRKVSANWLWIMLIPLGLLGVFGFYGLRFGDFLAYYHTGGVVPLVYPFAAFNADAKWVGTAWLEDIVFYFGLYALTVIALKDSKHRSFFYFSLVFLAATSLVQHRDIARYALPLWPMACIAFEKFLTSRQFLAGGVLLLPAILLYAWNFISHNTMPIGDWSPFL